MPADPVKRRRYDAPARRAAALETRRRICRAAEELFVRDGYARTTMRGVAREAAVSEATMYLVFATKAALLDAVIVDAVHGDGPTLDDVLAAPPAEVLRRFCALHAAVMRRAAHLIAIGEGAVVMDAELRPHRERAHAGLRGMLRTIAGRLADDGALRPGLTPDAAADVLYAIASEATYLRLVDGCGVPPERYADWLAEGLEGALGAGEA